MSVGPSRAIPLLLDWCLTTGCGKTMIAKATAREAGARFINLDTAVLTDKWYGESQKLAGAVFSLAEKIQPCIIFIDEIDSLLRSRDTHDHEATAMIKAQFMQVNFISVNLGSSMYDVHAGRTVKESNLHGRPVGTGQHGPKSVEQK